jgi:hypothetical protein
MLRSPPIGTQVGVSFFLTLSMPAALVSAQQRPEDRRGFMEPAPGPPTIRAAVEEAHALGLRGTVDAETFYSPTWWW